MGSERTEVFAPTDYRRVRESGASGTPPLRTSYKLCGETGDVGIVPYGGDKGEKEPSDFGF